ncbi:hypothetical protein D3C73_278810 [compost metagenome]
MIIQKGQVWKSKEHPHEDFEIYDSVEDGDQIIWFWKRVNSEAFDKFIKATKGYSTEELIKQGRNTFPYAWAGECSANNLKTKIKRFNMSLIN